MKKRACLLIFFVFSCLFFSVIFSACDADEPFTIDGATFNKEDDEFVLVVSNKCSSIDMEQIVHGSNDWYISLSLLGWLKEGKVLSLDVGLNKYYIHDEDANKIYKLQIKRLALYTVRFEYENGEYIDSIQVEENSLIKYDKIPSKLGYKFINWDDKINNPVIDDIRIVAKMEALEPVPFTVNYYHESLNGDYSLAETEIKHGYENEFIEVEVKDFDGFIKPDLQHVVVNKDGTTVLNYYYKRNTYDLKFVSNGGNQIESISLKYGQNINLPTSIRENYTFGGWFTDVEQTTSFDNLTMPSQTITLYAWWKEESKVKDFEYELNENAIINKYIGADKNIVLPEFIGGKILTEIAAKSFEGTKIETISFNNSINKIGKYCFWDCTLLKELVIPNTVKSIGEYIFKSCNSLEKLIIPYLGNSLDAVDKTLNYNFYYGAQYVNSLKSIELTMETIIPAYAFKNYATITDIKLPNSIEQIGEDAFTNCSNLTNVYVDSIAVWENIQFKNAMANPLVYAQNLYFNNLLLTDAVFTEGITKVNNYVFHNYKKLQSIIIPNTVKEIGSMAFSYSGIRMLQIPNTVQTIGSHIIAGCENIVKLITPFIGKTIDDNRSIYYFTYGQSTLKDIRITTAKQFVDNCFDYTQQLTSITIPKTIKEIGMGAFESCTKLQQVHIEDVKLWSQITFIDNFSNPMSKANYLYLINDLITDISLVDVKKISDYAFYNCHQLTSVTLPNGLNEIGDYAFVNCKFSQMVLPNSLVTIGCRAFDGCSNLSDIHIPISVRNIKYYAFDACSNLNISADANFEMGGWTDWNPDYRPVTWGLNNITSNNNFDYVVLENKIYLTRYKANEQNIIIPEMIDNKKVVSVGNIFAKNNAIKSIKLPSGAKWIDQFAFDGCNNLENVRMDNEVVEIGPGAFRNCNNLKDIIIHNGVLIIGSDAFYNCINLKIYVDQDVNIDSWGNSWNPSFCPIYVYSQVKPNGDITSFEGYWHYDIDGVSPIIW